MYRAAVIGLGWMGLLYDLASRIGDRFEIDDIDRPTPPLDIHRKFHHYDHPGDEGNPTSYAEALWDRPEVETVIAADRDPKRLKAYGERYGIEALYEDAEAMLRKERPDIVAVCTNTKYRAHFTCLAVECGAKGIVTEKPMVHTLEEVDRMVGVCAAAEVPLCCGAITTTHPSFARAKALLAEGAIGELVSIEAPRCWGAASELVVFPRRASGLGGRHGGSAEAGVGQRRVCRSGNVGGCGWDGGAFPQGSTGGAVVRRARGNGLRLRQGMAVVAAGGRASKGRQWRSWIGRSRSSMCRMGRCIAWMM